MTLRISFAMLTGLAVAISFSLPAISQETESINAEELYDEVIDKRPEEERLSPQERQERLIKEVLEKHSEKIEQKEPGTPPQGRHAPAQQGGKRPQRPHQAVKQQERPGGEKTTTTVGPAGGGEGVAAEVGDQATLGIVPLFTELFVGDEQVYTIRLDNPARSAYTKISFAIKYDPTVLEVLDLDPDLPGVNINAASAAGLGFDLKPDSNYFKNVVDANEGLIFFRTALAGQKSISEAEGALAQIRVRALRQRGSSSLQFVDVIQGQEIDKLSKNEPDQPATYLRMVSPEDRSQLRDITIATYGARLTVYASPDDTPSMVSESDIFDTRIRLVPEKEQVEVGEQFDVFAVLVNPQGVLFDSISLYLRYDPRVLKIVDTDENNRMTLGVNISDGEFEERFPLELCRANRADQDTGTIVYDMETFGEPLSAAGPFARIRFEALRPIKQTYVLFGFNAAGQRPTTGIFRYQADVLAEAGDWRDGVASEPVSIVR